MGITESLCCMALELTTANADLVTIAKWFPIHLQRWADPELELLKEWKDLSAFKQKIAAEYAILMEKRQQVEASLDKDSSHCVFCGGPLSKDLFIENGCLKCVAPIIAATCDLIRATTTRYTPESIYEYWCMIAGVTVPTPVVFPRR